jgi:hypothetical protein
MNPKLVDPPAASPPFQAAFDAVTVEPVAVTAADHDCVTAPPPGSVKVVVQRVSGAVPAVTSTVAW